MKIHNIIILLLIVTPLFFGCIEKDQGYKDFASEELDLNKEFVMSSCKIICKTNKETPISFGEKKTFFKISDDMFKKSHNIVDSLFERERRVNPPARPYPIEHYYLQYAGYSEGGRKYVYVNLSTFMRLRTVQLGLVLLPGMGSCVYLNKEDGYAGYIIIDIKDGRVVKYKFEENETTPIPTEYDCDAQPGSKGFNYNLKGSSADEKMSIGNSWMFILTLLFCFSCSRKKPMNYLYYGNEEHLEWIMVEPMYSNGKSFFNKDRIKDSIDDEDLLYINKIIKKKMETIEGALPFEEYFKQYIAYKEKGRKMVYVNMFEYIPVVNGLTPEIPRRILNINDENCSKGYIIIDYSTGKIIECKFNE